MPARLLPAKVLLVTVRVPRLTIPPPMGPKRFLLRLAA